MGSWAEIMIVREAQEESRVKQEAIALRNKIAKERKREANALALRLFHCRSILENEWFWKIIAYTYFVCKTLGLFILIDFFIFGRPNTIVFIFIFFCCYYLSLKLYKKRKLAVRAWNWLTGNH